MTDSKLSALTEMTTPLTTDLVYVVDDPGGTPTSQKITFANFGKAIVATGALNAGSITSGFGNIDVGASTIDGGTITADTAFSGTSLTNAAAITISSTGAGVNITTHTDAGDDFTVNTDKLVVEGDTGHIGIGTADPSYMIHVKDGSSGATASTDADNYVLERNQAGGMSILTPDNSRSRLYFGSPSDTSGGIISWKFDDLSMYMGTGKGGASTIITSGGSHPTLTMDGNGNTTFQSRIDSTTAFQILDADGGTPIVNVDATNERVGIGTDVPIAKLSIEAGASKGLRVSTNTTGNVIEFGTGTGANDYTWSIYKNGNDLAFYDRTAATTNVTFETGGNVGIGTASPSRKLQVRGDVLFGNAAGNGGIYFNDSSDNEDTYIYHYNNDRIAIAIDGSAEVITIKSSGNVGIGTASPNQLFTVENSISLKEIAAANADTAAYGQIWVKNDTPNTLWFTDDAGTDTQLGVGGGLSWGDSISGSGETSAGLTITDIPSNTSYPGISLTVGTGISSRGISCTTTAGRGMFLQSGTPTGTTYNMFIFNASQSTANNVYGINLSNGNGSSGENTGILITNESSNQDLATSSSTFGDGAGLAIRSGTNTTSSLMALGIVNNSGNHTGLSIGIINSAIAAKTGMEINMGTSAQAHVGIEFDGSTSAKVMNVATNLTQAGGTSTGTTTKEIRIQIAGVAYTIEAKSEA